MAVMLIFTTISCNSISLIDMHKEILSGTECNKWYSEESTQVCEFCQNGKYNTYTKKNDSLVKNQSNCIIGFQVYWGLDTDSLYIKYPKNRISSSLKINSISHDKICFESKNERYRKEICYQVYWRNHYDNK